VNSYGLRQCSGTVQMQIPMTTCRLTHLKSWHRVDLHCSAVAAVRATRAALLGQQDSIVLNHCPEGVLAGIRSTSAHRHRTQLRRDNHPIVTHGSTGSGRASFVVRCVQDTIDAGRVTEETGPTASHSSARRSLLDSVEVGSRRRSRLIWAPRLGEARARSALSG